MSRPVAGKNGYDGGTEDPEGVRKGGRVGEREMRDRQPERGEDSDTESEPETRERNRNREKRDRQ